MPFRWQRATQYEWVECEPPPELRRAGHPRVQALRPIGPENQQYEPLTDAPHLFREFAELDGFALSIHTFTTKYGRLGLPSLSEEEPIENAEDWWDEIRSVFKVLGAWDVLRGEASEYLETTILYDVRGSTRKRLNLLGEMITNGVNAARERHGLFPRLALASPDTMEFAETYEPQTLIGAIWTQAIEAITRRVDYVRCANTIGCERWIERSASKRGPKATYCSPLCCAKVDQRTLTKARQLARNGLTERDIIQNTGLSLRRVRAVAQAAKRVKRKRRAR